MKYQRDPKLKKLRPRIHHFSGNPCRNRCKAFQALVSKFQQALSFGEAHKIMHSKFLMENRGIQPRKQSIKNENNTKKRGKIEEPMKAPFQISFNGLGSVGG